MDLKINNSFITGIIERLLKRLLKKKLDIDVDITFTQLEVLYENDTAHVLVGAFADTTKDNVKKLLQKVNL